MEPDILKMYLIEDYASIAAQLADAGLEMIFTGHMHANDIAVMTTKSGNTLYDVETGSNLTYPSPMRFVQLREVSGSLVAAVNTLNHIGPVLLQRRFRQVRDHRRRDRVRQRARLHRRYAPTPLPEASSAVS